MSSSTSNQNLQSKERRKKKKDKPLQESSNITGASSGAGASNFQDSEFGAIGGMCNGDDMADMEIQVMQTTGCQVSLSVWMIIEIEKQVSLAVGCDFMIVNPCRCQSQRTYFFFFFRNTLIPLASLDLDTKMMSSLESKNKC